MPRTIAKYLCLFLFSCATATLLVAQADLSSLTGLITDSSGASIKGAKVTAQGIETGLVRNTASDSSGYYNFTSLPVGRYQISVDETGFTRASTSVMLDPSARTRQDFQFQIGTTSTSVNVQADPELAHDSASLGTVIENQVIEGTPLVERKWDDLIRLVPGIQQNRYTEQSGATASGRTGDFTTNGVHSLQNDFILDGIDNNTFSENVQELTTEAARPSVDVIQEFR